MPINSSVTHSLMKRLILLLCLFAFGNAFQRRFLSRHYGSNRRDLFFNRERYPSVEADFKELLAQVECANKGLDKSNQKEVLSSMGAIVERSLNSKGSTVNKRKLEGTWDLLYTTEKETLFFYKNGLFGAKCTYISQSIDLDSNLINNVISFDKGKEFSVLGAISVDDGAPKRINFKFTSASLKFSEKFKLAVPPVGEGWFDTLYVDDSYRISHDVRGDWLLSKRRKKIVR